MSSFFWKVSCWWPTEKGALQLCILHYGFVVPNFDLKKEKDTEMVMNLSRCSGLALTSQKRAVDWEKECDLGRDEPPFCLWVTKFMYIFYVQSWFGCPFPYDQQKQTESQTDRKAGSSESCFMVIVTKETNSLVFMCSADGRSESLRLRRYHRMAQGRRRDENSQTDKYGNCLRICW